LRYTKETERWRRRLCFRVRLRFRLKLEPFFMLPPPHSVVVPLVVPDALLDPALLDFFTGLFLESGISRVYLYPTRTRICIPNPPPLFFYLS
jgi:hypothetical protein